MHVQGNNIFAHERLAIVDVQNGAQPLFNEVPFLSLSLSHSNLSLSDSEELT
jgi:asparagine synthetase B (glutamine-hydrolysing)